MNCRSRSFNRSFGFVGIALLFFVFYHSTMAQNASPAPQRDINAVLAAHDRDLLALPDVVGVSVTTLDDHRTPCLKIMLARHNPKTERAIPRSIEGYPVIFKVTGEIRALDQP
ncbi:MAG TPA: hypothetical protein VFO30_08835 [Chthoniobacterales bacterium]|nr:hypothetical protein [Chthoniobacterales bacterium]